MCQRPGRGFTGPSHDYISAVFLVILSPLLLSCFYCTSITLLFRLNFVVFADVLKSDTGNNNFDGTRGACV